MESETTNNPRGKFDYFADHGGGAGHLLEDPEEAAAQRLRLRRKLLFAMATSSVFLLVVVWLAWDYRDLIRYSFSSPRPPQQLGDVVDMTPADIPHNAYVTITGITEHRGMKQMAVRGIVPWRQEYWYFRLLGSRGVFIEVPPDAEHFGFTTQVTVSGRAVDPDRSLNYRVLLGEYRKTFNVPEGGEIRFIQVGVAPGDYRWSFIVVFVIFALIAALDLFTILRFVRARQASPRVVAATGTGPDAG